MTPLHSRSLPMHFIVTLLAVAAWTQPALAGDCSDHCLRVWSIGLTNLGDRIRGIVRLTDENGSATATRSAVVHVVWRRPDGSVQDQYDIIGTRLRAEYSLYTAGEPGTYELVVAGATKDGYTFDPVNSGVLSQSIQIGAAPDGDQDGIVDAADNCTLSSNPDQRDTDGDGFGNACDADLNNDCIVNGGDLALLRAVFFGQDANADMNGDGIVNIVDLALVKASFFAAPGPSALAQCQ